MRGRHGRVTRGTTRPKRLHHIYIYLLYNLIVIHDMYVNIYFFSIYIHEYIYINSSCSSFYIYTGWVKKTAFYVFVNISAHTLRREASRLSTELSWQDVSNHMRLDFLRQLVLEKIDDLCEILTLIGWSITLLIVYESLLSFFAQLNIGLNFSPPNLSSLREVFLVLNVHQRIAVLYFSW